MKNISILTNVPVEKWFQKNSLKSILHALLDRKNLDSDENIFNNILLESQPIKEVSFIIK